MFVYSICVATFFAKCHTVPRVNVQPPYITVSMYNAAVAYPFAVKDFERGVGKTFAKVFPTHNSPSSLPKIHGVDAGAAVIFDAGD